MHTHLRDQQCLLFQNGIGRRDLVGRFEGRRGLEDKRAQYAAQVLAVDESVGRIRDALRASGLDRETVP